MHDIWNPWHGCVKCSEGCLNCYMYYLDRIHNNSDSSIVYRTNSFDYPLSKYRDGSYKIKSGEQIRVCMTSDFFIAQADVWRGEAWNVIRERSDVAFFLLTKRPERVLACLPDDWGDGWDNVFFNVTCENQRRADERIPLLLELPFKHKGIMCAPFIGEITIGKYLDFGQIEQVICGGENYDGARPCRFEWVQCLKNECEEHNVTFCFIETGTVFVKDGVSYRLPDKRVQARMAHASGMNYNGKPINWNFKDRMGIPIPDYELYKPHFSEVCQTCGSKLICNGCSDCGKCKDAPDIE